MGRRQWEGWGEGRVKNYNGKMEVMVMTGVDDIEASQCPSPSLEIPLGEGLLSGSLVHTHPHIPHTPSHTLSATPTSPQITLPLLHTLLQDLQSIQNQSVDTCLYMPRDVCSAIW